MSRFKAFAVASCLGVLAVAFVPARADEWNKKTILTVNEPVALPNTVLEPGKYVIKLMDSQSNRHIVQVFTDGEQKLITTLLAIPDYRIEPANDSSFSFWETGAGQPRALRAWFYPGDNFGQEFAYPKDMALKIAQAAKENVPAIVTDNSADVNNAEVRTMTPSGETQELAQNTQPQTSASTQSSTDTMKSESTTSTDQSAAVAPSNESASSSMNNQQSATTESPANGQNVHAMPENNQTAQSTTSQSATSSTTDTTASQTPENNTSASSTAGTGVSATDNSASANSGSMNRNELPRTASPLPLTGLAGLGAAAAALVARFASKR